MATINELIYKVKNLIHGGLGSDDSSISDELVLSFFNTERARLIKEEADKKRLTGAILIQDLGCVEIRCADKVECCNFPELESQEYIHKTVKQIPTPLYGTFEGLSNPAMITYIGLVTKDKPFEFTSSTITRWAKYKKWTSKIPRAYYLDKYIYITNLYPSNIRFINIQGIFENPLAVSEFNDCSGKVCFSNDSDYPITPYLESPLIQMVMDKYMQYLMQPGLRDTKNDAIDPGDV